MDKFTPVEFNNRDANETEVMCVAPDGTSIIVSFTRREMVDMLVNLVENNVVEEMSWLDDLSDSLRDYR